MIRPSPERFDFERSRAASFSVWPDGFPEPAIARAQGCGLARRRPVLLDTNLCAGLRATS